MPLTLKNFYRTSRLPAEYQEVQYIQSSGTQYIKTGYIAQSGDTATIKFNMLTCIGDEQWIFAIWENPYGYRAGVNHGTWETSNGFSYDVTGLNTDIIATGNCSGNFTKECYLFAQNENNTPYHLNKGTMKLYSCIIYRNGDAIRDFVPCYRKLDSVIGLYDMANGVFYTNNGSGTFTKGPDIGGGGAKGGNNTPEEEKKEEKEEKDEKEQAIILNPIDNGSGTGDVLKL